MTVVEKQHTNENYYIAMELKQGYNTMHYEVVACPIVDDNLCGYPIRSMTYSLDEKKKAENTFRRYKNTYK